MSTQARAAIPSPETSLGDSFAWPFRDPEWFNKIVLMGLISIIPIVGWLQLLGWMLAALDNLRHGWQVLPPAGFRYATRGINLFAASLIWGLAVAVLIYGSMGVAIFAMLSLAPRSSNGGSSDAFPLFFFPLMFGLTAAFGLIIVAIYVLIPPLIVFTDRTGLGGAFNVAGFVHAIRSSPQESVYTAAPLAVSVMALRRPSRASLSVLISPLALSRDTTSAIVDRSSDTRLPRVRWSRPCGSQSSALSVANCGDVTVCDTSSSQSRFMA